MSEKTQACNWCKLKKTNSKRPKKARSHKKKVTLGGRGRDWRSTGRRWSALERGIALVKFTLRSSSDLVRALKFLLDQIYNEAIQSFDGFGRIVYFTQHLKSRFFPGFGELLPGEKVRWWMVFLSAYFVDQFLYCLRKRKLKLNGIIHHCFFVLGLPSLLWFVSAFPWGMGGGKRVILWSVEEYIWYFPAACLWMWMDSLDDATKLWTGSFKHQSFNT